MLKIEKVWNNLLKVEKVIQSMLKLKIVSQSVLKVKEVCKKKEVKNSKSWEKCKSMLKRD